MKNEKKILFALLLRERYKKYPTRTLLLITGIAIIVLGFLNNYLGFGSAQYDFLDRLIICVGLLGCAVGFISPKIDSGDLLI